MYIDNLKTNILEKAIVKIGREELFAYLDLLYLLGIKTSHHTNVKEIFAPDGTGIATAAMSYKKFLTITRCLRFDDKTTSAERRKFDKLAAIRDFFGDFVRNCRSSFNLTEYTTIDKMLHPLRGRCNFIQYIPSKPAKYGIMFALCGAKCSYTSTLEIYCGKHPLCCKQYCL